MNHHDIRTLNDEGLLMLLTRGGDEPTRRDAANELHRRGSRYINTSEFEPFRRYVYTDQGNYTDHDTILDALAETNTQIAKSTRKIVVWLAAVTTVNLIALLLHVVRYITR